MNQDRPDSGTVERPARSPAATFTRVMIVQAITLLVLWLLQSTFGQG